MLKIKNNLNVDGRQPWAILVNPAAGSGKAHKIWPRVEKKLNLQGIDHQVAFSDGPGDISRLASQFVHNGFRRFAAMGGDGTLNELINGLFDQDLVNTQQILIASIPIGTGNDWIKSHYPGIGLTDIITLMGKGRYDYQDVGLVSGSNGQTVHFGNVAEFGFGGLVVQRIRRLKRFRLGALAYLVGILAGLYQYRPTKIHFMSDQNNGDSDLFNLVVAIGNFAGGGMKISPSALTDDGLFDITIVEPIKPLKAVANLAKLFDGSFVNLPEVTVFQSSQLQIATDDEVMAEVDGDVIGIGGNFTISIRKKALRVLSP